MPQPTDLAPVLLIGGAGPPAPREFAALIQALADGRTLVPVDLIAFQGVPFPAGYSLAIEADALLAAVRATGAERAHFVGYSGGAAAALAFADRYPAHVASLALEETAWVGNDDAPEIEREFWAALAEAMSRPPAEALVAFRGLLVTPDILPPPDVPADAPWVADMVKGISTLSQAFVEGSVDWPALRAAGVLVYCAVGALSHPVFELRSRRVQERMPGTVVEVYEGLHHIMPPHRNEPERFASRLRELWARAEA